MHSGVVLSVEKDTAGFITLVIDDAPVRTVSLTKDIVRNPKEVCERERGREREGEREREPEQEMWKEKEIEE